MGKNAKQECLELIKKNQFIINTAFIQMNSNARLILTDLILFPIVENSFVKNFEVHCLFENGVFVTIEKLEVVLNDNFYKRVD
ncbi:MAG: hypothetical protein IPK31_07165 [Chitinophagaceae bacterium]|nr:hypothetical protein [Chitinophagaceae bacterium]